MTSPISLFGVENYSNNHVQKFLYRRRESSAADSSRSSEALAHCLPCLTPAEGCSGLPGAPSRKLKPTGEASSLRNGSRRFPRAAEYRRSQTTADAYLPVPRWSLAFRTGRRRARLRLCRGPTRQPGSSRRSTAGSEAAALPRRCPPASPPHPALHRIGGTNLQRRLPGEREGAWAAQRRAWEGSWAVPVRRGRGDAAGERRCREPRRAGRSWCRWREAGRGREGGR
ncbi:uncharacterized protein LOC120411542 [Corvus cornix cornix]|uniref:uncharacterized protein LOC120411542 n=1 Tax=Corvus cornix cornix TaxID=932674 RepID=UPI0019513A77|nr:uncharacterized protein LOC120411542 [Corvus cornix cornix]XP_041869123.1 uncharacterized protein LOC121657465 [Corvus kubaryi]